MLTPAFKLQAWIDEHRHLLKPPVGNKCIVDGDFIVMIVGGPNQRTDYHWDEGPEFFYQLEGEMVLKIQEDGMARDIPIKAGEMFYLPPRTPHSPQRLPDSIGLVIERKRLAHEPNDWLARCTMAKAALLKGDRASALREVEQLPNPNNTACRVTPAELWTISVEKKIRIRIFGIIFVLLDSYQFQRHQGSRISN